MIRLLSRYSWFVVVVCALASFGQERVVDGPPPEIRSHLQAFVKAFNSGSAEQWEAMAQEHYSAQALKSRTPEQRKQMFDRMRGDFGSSISISRVERDGRDAPLQVSIKGSTGLEATLQIELEQDSPFKI